MSARRLLWLVDSLGRGGAEALTVPFARTLDRSQFELTVAAISGAEGLNADRLRECGVDVVDLRARSLRDVLALRRLFALLRERKIDLIHAHLTYSAIWSAIATRLTGIPSIASLHVSVEATRSLHTSMRHRLLTGVRDDLLKKVANAWSSRVVLVSAALRDAYVDAGLNREKARVVHNGIEVERFRRPRAETRARLNAEFAVPADVPLVAMVSVLRPGKGVEVLIDAISSVPDATFLIIGDGPMRDEWSARAAAKGVAHRIRWAGFRGDVDQLLAGCDLFVHPSLDDAFPTVLLEAMAAGLPVVATRVGGIPEIVTAGVTGELVPPSDAPRLGAAIASLLSDREALQQMSAHAAAGADRFSTEAWVGRLVDVYRDVTSTAVRHEQRIAVGA